MQDINFSSFTPVMGRWFIDAGPDFSDLFFDITDFDNYPPILRLNNSYYTFNAVTLFLNYHERDLVNPTNFDGCKVIPNVEERALYHLFSIVENARLYFARKNGLEDIMALATPKTTFGLFPPEIQKKRAFFLEVASQVIFTNRSITDVAREYRVDPTNVSIWASLLVSHGPKTFFKKPNYCRGEWEDRAVKSYLEHRNTFVSACAENLIFTRNSFKNMLRRYYRQPPPPTA